MQKIHQFQDVVLLSDKEVHHVAGSRVWFNDGSLANLEELAFSNRGPGEIKFKLAPEEIVSAVPKIFNFRNARTITLKGGDLHFEIQETDSAINSVELLGSEQFYSAVRTYESAEGLLVEVEQKPSSVIVENIYINGRRVKGKPIEGKMVIKTHAQTSLHIETNGHGFGQVNVPLQGLNLRTSGSLRLDCGSVDSVSIRATGSGNVDIGSVSRACNIEISGSGRVNIASGNLSRIKAIVSGSGVINAAVIVQNADLKQTGTGAIFIGHVVQESHEVHGASGTIVVMKRG
jgi:hypothetical protein